jgi:hypothetical protein
MRYIKLFEGYLDLSYEKIDCFPSDIELDEKETGKLLGKLKIIIDENNWDITPILYANQIQINGCGYENWKVNIWILLDTDEYYYVRYDDGTSPVGYGDHYRCDGKDEFFKLLKDKGVL